MQNLFGEETALGLAAQMGGAIHETAPEECHDMAALAESHISQYNAYVVKFFEDENQLGRATIGPGFFVLREDMIEDGSLTTTGLFLIFHEALHLFGKTHLDFDPIGDDEGSTNFHNFASSCVEGIVGGGGGHPDPV